MNLSNLSIIRILGFTLSCGGISAGLFPRGAGAQPAGDWPYYRHDLQLTGRSPGRGRMREAPVEKWRWRPGGPAGLIELTHQRGATARAPLGGGKPFGGAYLAQTTSKWHPTPLVDLAGDGKLVPSPGDKLGRLLPDVKGLQRVVFEAVADPPNSARGRCYSYAEGAASPKLVWETEVEKEVYERLWTLGDMDGDG